MNCEQCEGRGIVQAQESEWRPKTWNGVERRKYSRPAPEVPKWAEAKALFYVSCPACGGLGKIVPGLSSAI